jgi:hypothetical protein
MNVITNRRIIDGDNLNDDYSNAGGKKPKKKRTGEFGKNVREKTQKGYIRLKEAGGIPVIENLLGLTPSQTVVESTNLDIQPPSDTKPPMSTTKKVLIGVGIAGAIGLIWYFGFRKNASKNARKK